MTCDRCGEFVPEGGGGRCRLAKMTNGSREVVVDLCDSCQAAVGFETTQMVKQWGSRVTQMPQESEVS